MRSVMWMVAALVLLGCAEDAGDAPATDAAGEVQFQAAALEDLCLHEMDEAVWCTDETLCIDIYCRVSTRGAELPSCDDPGGYEDWWGWPCPGEVYWWCDEEPPRMRSHWFMACTERLPAWESPYLLPWFRQAYPDIVVPVVPELQPSPFE